MDAERERQDTRDRAASGRILRVRPTVPPPLPAHLAPPPQATADRYYPVPLRRIWTPPSSAWPLPPPPPRRSRLLLPRLAALVALAVPVAIVIHLANAPAPLARGPSAATGPPTPIPAPDTGPVPRFEPRECTVEFQMARYIECGDLVVLEDRNQPEGRRIRLRVATQYESRRRAESSVPVIYLDGGPGGSPLEDGFAGYLLAERGKLIVLDQRGVGLSDPSLVCHEARLLLLQANYSAARECRRRLVDAGVNLGAYTTAASAADVEDLRRALGIEQWDLYGVSYGTRLALNVLRDYPAGVRSAILDSAYPPGADIYADGARNAQRAFDQLFAACAVDAGCSGAFPDLGPRFYGLLQQLNEEPVTARGGLLDLRRLQIDGKLLALYLHDQMYSTWALSILPATLDEFMRGEWTTLSEWYWSLLELAPLRPAGGVLVSEGMYLSVQCAEAIPFLDRERSEQVEMGVRPAMALAFDWALMVEYCEIWDVPAVDERATRPVSSDVPVLLLAGTYDPVTPPAWAEAAAEHLRAAHVVVAPGVAHGVLDTSRCIDEIVHDFLDDPAAVDLDTGCVADLEEPEFWLPD